MALFDFGTGSIPGGGGGGSSSSPFSSGMPSSSAPPANYGFSPFQKQGTGIGAAGSNQYSPYGQGGFGMYNGSIPNPPASQLNLGYGGISQSPSGMKSGVPGIGMGSTQDPQLTMQFFNWLQSQIGTGMNPYPGQLTAPPNDIMNAITSLFTNGSSTSPALQGLNQMAKTGNPTDVGPAWDAMLKAQQQNIQQNQAGLKEQFAFGGNLAGSPFGNAMSNFQSQTTADQNSLLAQMQQQASEAAAGRQLNAQEGILGAGLQGSQELQGINQLGLSNQYNEWQRTQPQNNPLLQYLFGASTTYPPYFQLPQKSSPWAGLAQGAGSILGAIGDAGLL